LPKATFGILCASGKFLLHLKPTQVSALKLGVMHQMEKNAEGDILHFMRLRQIFTASQTATSQSTEAWVMHQMENLPKATRLKQYSSFTIHHLPFTIHHLPLNPIFATNLRFLTYVCKNSSAISGRRQ
jgi:hypothetical protein